MNNRYWRIRGYDGFNIIFEMKVELGQFSDRQIQDLLRALAAKEGLSYREIVGAYAKRRTKIANDLLEVRKDANSPVYTCGSDPYFTVSLVDEKGKIIRYPRV